MADEKKKRRGIGSISQFATLGNKAPEDQSTQEPEAENAIASSDSSTQVTCSPNAIASKPLNSKTIETQVAQTPSSLEPKELENLNAQESSGQSVQDTEHQNVEAPETQVAQESKRLIQVSEEELKRLMVEALQSQSTQAPKQQEKPKRLRQTVYLEPDLHKQVRHRIADTGEDISDVVNLALRKLLEE